MAVLVHTELTYKFVHKLGTIFPYLCLALGHGQGHGYGAGCDLDVCTRAYDESLERRGLAGPEGSAAFCGVLYDFGTCMYSIRRACRGNIRYHTSNSMLIHLKTSGAAAAGPECSYRGGKAFRHCGLFGDPHLRTFTGAMQTCRVQGAWPLVDNRYLAVQVTNEPVLEDSNATATTKVTVLVKGSATPCTNQKTKTYEATADAALPDTFIDGTNTSGPGEAVTVRTRGRARCFGPLWCTQSVQMPLSRVPAMCPMTVLHLLPTYSGNVRPFAYFSGGSAPDSRGVRVTQFALTTLFSFPQVGRYLAFSTRMPEELVSTLDAQVQGDGQGDGVQLCVQGCPHSERMNLDKDRGAVLSWTDALEKCVSKTRPATAPASSSSSPSSDEVLGDLTDQYLDWCVFDLMTTGREDFALAAHAALRDTLAMDPSAAGSLRNRTTAQDVGASDSAGGAASSSTFLLIDFGPTQNVQTYKSIDFNLVYYPCFHFVQICVKILMSLLVSVFGGKYLPFSTIYCPLISRCKNFMSCFQWMQHMLTKPIN
ncbi:repulsive guidance molecule A-like [Thrips palmi]|uniref:Repulsive guidance molecule A-like n=1 Tax=Thrips palmi TaxID=161013 RepID=A0A6P8YSW6_THRPL|nr:repulsive guidance molecule A-like [Thrips palmi]